MYEGDFCRGERHGNGTCTFPGGERYTGSWKGGKMHGEGVLEINGRRLTGATVSFFPLSATVFCIEIFWCYIDVIETRRALITLGSIVDIIDSFLVRRKPGVLRPGFVGMRGQWPYDYGIQDYEYTPNDDVKHATQCVSLAARLPIFCALRVLW